MSAIRRRLSPPARIGLALLLAGFAAFRPSATQAAKISGRVLDPGGLPVSGIALLFVPDYLVTSHGEKTDAKGQFECALNLQASGGANPKVCVVARDSIRNLAAAEDIEEDTTTLELHLAAGLTVSGGVTDLSGKPLTNGTTAINLWIGNMGSPILSEGFKSDARGRFVIKALPANRRYWLWTTAPGYGSATQNIQISEAETNFIELEPFPLKLADHPLAGRVVDADDKPVAKARVHLNGVGQPSESVQTDTAGWFRFKGVCEGALHLFANVFAGGKSSYASVSAEAGDTNVVIVLGSNATGAPQRAKRPSLNGKPLPDLASVGLGAADIPKGKPLLICLFDIEQRPSRRFTRRLAERFDDLRQSDVVVVGVQAAAIADAVFKEWQADNAFPFPVGRTVDAAAAAKWAVEVESFPWMILTGADRKVVAEGFELEDLDAKLKPLKK